MLNILKKKAKEYFTYNKIMEFQIKNLKLFPCAVHGIYLGGESPLHA